MFTTFPKNKYFHRRNSATFECSYCVFPEHGGILATVGEIQLGSDRETGNGKRRTGATGPGDYANRTRVKKVHKNLTFIPCLTVKYCS